MLSLYPKQALSHPVNALPPSPVVCSSITALTFRRRYDSYIVWDFGGLSNSSRDHTHTCCHSAFLMTVVPIVGHHNSRVFLPKRLLLPIVGPASIGRWERCM